MELWLVRHGSTLAGEEGRFQGRCDYPLSGVGIREAVQLAGRLRMAGDFDLLLSSDLRRARLTAEIISRGIRLSPLSEPLLRECSWGYIEGMKRSDVEDRHPFLFHPVSGTLKALRCGGESERKLLARTRTLRHKIRLNYCALRRILLVSHGRLLNALISGCLGFSSTQKWPYCPSPASLSIIKLNPDGEEYSLMLFNDTCHLKG